MPNSKKASTQTNEQFRTNGKYTHAKHAKNNNNKIATSISQKKKTKNKQQHTKKSVVQRYHTYNIKTTASEAANNTMNAKPSKTHHSNSTGQPANTIKPTIENFLFF